MGTKIEKSCRNLILLIGLGFLIVFLCGRLLQENGANEFVMDFFKATRSGSEETAAPDLWKSAPDTLREPDFPSLTLSAEVLPKEAVFANRTFWEDAHGAAPSQIISPSMSGSSHPKLPMALVDMTTLLERFPPDDASTEARGGAARKIHQAIRLRASALGIGVVLDRSATSRHMEVPFLMMNSENVPDITCEVEQELTRQ